ncbi:MAG: DUF3786 domain-containing protein [Desulfobacterales bacterium]|nr:DUF3786 domain-containing protein [Desulfobacterales bacterium]
MSLVSPVFEQHYKDYLNQLATLDLEALGPAAGGQVRIGQYGPELVIPYFTKEYVLSPNGIKNQEGKKPGYDTCIILSRYLIMAKDWVEKISAETSDDPWVGFRDLKDSGPLTVYFKDNVEAVIGESLSGKGKFLEDILAPLQGAKPDIELQYDLALEVNSLPKVPLLLLFNDAEEGFPATCSVLFRSETETFLDAECIAMAGYRLAAIISKQAQALV